MQQDLELLVKSVTWEAPGILSWDLRAPDRAALPEFRAGAHIDLQLANGLVRSYSLVNSEAERHRYVIAVKKEEAGRGGSRFLHERVRPGERLRVSAPRNDFALVEDAPHSVLVAGGIGITPILAMARRLAELGRPWTLYYCARRRAQAAFLEALEQLQAPGCKLVHVFDEEPGGRPLDLTAVVEAAPREAHLYCCGPKPMLAAFEAATAGWPEGRVHVEYFAAKEAPATGGGYVVALARSGREFAVPAGRTILDVLVEAGIRVPHACTEGVCGTCETRVLEGVPDHRDAILSKAEREANATMFVCCSGSRSARLVLDL